MLLLSRLEPVTSEEITVGTKYVLLSEAQEQLYLLTDPEIRFVKIFGRPIKYGLYACVIENVDRCPSKEKSVPFFGCRTTNMYKYKPHSYEDCDLSIDWSR